MNKEKPMSAKERACKALCQCGNEGRSCGTAYHASTCTYLNWPRLRDTVAKELRAAERAAGEAMLAQVIVLISSWNELGPSRIPAIRALTLEVK